MLQQYLQQFHRLLLHSDSQPAFSNFAGLERNLKVPNRTTELVLKGSIADLGSLRSLALRPRGFRIQDIHGANSLAIN